MPDTNQIAEYLKNQYPQYASVPNDRLTAAFLAKYPKQIQGPAANYLANQIQGPAANYLQNLLAFQSNQNQLPNLPMQGQAQSPLDPRLQSVAQQFPRLNQYLENVRLREGKKTSATDDRALEFYPPWESENPNPGKITLELFDKMQGQSLTNALAGDMLHYLGAIDPVSRKPVDPRYYEMKQEVKNSRTPAQEALDRRIWTQATASGQETRSYDDWLQQSRIDAYIRGFVTPEIGGRYPDEWRQHGFYKEPRMREAVEAIHRYVTAGNPSTVSEKTVTAPPPATPTAAGKP